MLGERFLEHAHQHLFIVRTQQAFQLHADGRDVIAKKDGHDRGVGAELSVAGENACRWRVPVDFRQFLSTRAGRVDDAGFRMGQGHIVVDALPAACICVGWRNRHCRIGTRQGER